MSRSIPVRLRLALALGVIAACLAVYAVGALATDLTFPPFTGRVVDAAGILMPEQRQALVAKLKAHAGRTSDQVVIATVPSLQGTSVEDYANRLFRTWKLGGAKTNNGVLLLVAPREHKIHIEVGYGLEGALTDALSRTITGTAVKPRFKVDDWYGGLDAAVDAILAILEQDAQEQQRKPEPPSDEVNLTQVAVFVILFLIVAVVAWRMLRHSGGGVVVGPSDDSSDWGGGFSDSGFSESGAPDSGPSSDSDDNFAGGGGSSGGGGASDDW